MTIVWRMVAKADRQRIFDYIAQDNPRAALELDENFKDKAAIAERHPEMFKQGRVPGTREIVVPPNYILIYRVSKRPAGVVIARILHAKQKWP
jgi:addiction module RelE/StbE family toxin